MYAICIVSHVGTHNHIGLVTHITTQSQSHSVTHTRIVAHISMSSLILAHYHIVIVAHICMRSLIRIHYHIVIVAHTHSRIYIHALTNTRTLSHSHSRTYMHALTHTHTHSRYIDIGNPFPISIVVISMCQFYFSISIIPKTFSVIMNYGMFLAVQQQRYIIDQLPPLI